jgi:hypothetical protein
VGPSLAKVEPASALAVMPIILPDRPGRHAGT